MGSALERETRDIALERAREQLSEVLALSDALGEVLLAAHVSIALDTTLALLAEPVSES